MAAPAARPASPARLAALAERVPTAPIAAAGLIAGFGVAQATGSRPLGGVVLAALGLTCVAVWARRDGRRTAARLTATGLLAFAVSHLLGLVIGAWPSVIVVGAATAAVCWWLSDSRRAPASASFQT
jgi:tetrahydromethanopterin S-methyltransferase subunit C